MALWGAHRVVLDAFRTDDWGEINGHVMTNTPQLCERSAMALKQWVSIGVAVIATFALAVTIEDPKLARGSIIASFCLILWLTEAIPLYATTLLLWVGTVLLLSPLDSQSFGVNKVLSSAAHPVMALFFGGFALSIA